MNSNSNNNKPPNGTSEEKTVIFRYSHWYEYWSAFLGGVILVFAVLFVLFRIALNNIGINEVNMSPFWDMHSLLALSIALGGCVFIVVFSWFFSWWTARKITDRQGTAVFNEKSVSIFLKNKTLIYNYTDIKKIEYVEYIYSKQWQGILAAPKADLVFYSNTGKYKISTSVEESWQWFKKQPLRMRMGLGKSNPYRISYYRASLPVPGVFARMKYHNFSQQFQFFNLKNELTKYVNVVTVEKHKTW